jgi:hypothetical protein
MTTPTSAARSPRARGLAGVVLALATATLFDLPLVSAQQPAEPPAVDWRMPFRVPADEIAPPADVWKHLRTMLAIRDAAAPDRISFDEHGREVVDDEGWRAAREALLTTNLDPGYLSLIIRESAAAGDRRIAMYGMFYVAAPEVVFQLIEHIPGEPLRQLREEAFPRAVEFAAAHVAKKNPGDVEEWRKRKLGPAAERGPRPGDWSYGFDAAPFVALLELDDWRDHAQALWFLGRIVELREDTRRNLLGGALPHLPAALTSEHQILKDQAIAFLEACDPSPEDLPGDDEAALLDWLDRVTYEVFPPIREVHPGTVELWPSEDRDRLVSVATAGLASGSLGATRFGTAADGSNYRGFELTTPLPEPLERLTLPDHAIITAINGLPTGTGDEILLAIRSALRGKGPWPRVLFVELVHDGKRQVFEFRVQA